MIRIRVTAARRGSTAGRMPTGHSLAPPADVPDRQRRDGFPQPVIRRKYSVIAMPVLPRRRDEIGKPVEKLKRREVDDAVRPRPRGLAAATASDPVGRLMSRQHVADASDLAVCTATHRESLERKGGPGAIAQQVFETPKIAGHVAVDERDPDTRVDGKPELGDGGPAEVSGVLFCRARRMLDETFLTGNQLMLGRQMLLERCAYQQFWIHQFLRVKVVRHLFSCFPEMLQPASVMDPLKRAVPKPADHRLWVTAANCAVFGESTRAGILTENCIESMRQHGMPIPNWQPAVAAPVCIIGQSSFGDDNGIGAFDSTSEDGAE